MAASIYDISTRAYTIPPKFGRSGGINLKEKSFKNLVDRWVKHGL
jgi:hypothetical protein